MKTNDDVAKPCLRCKKDIASYHHKATRCTPCAAIHKKEYFRMYMAKYSLKKKMERFNDRTLDDAHLLSSNYMTGCGTFDLPSYQPDFEREAKIIAGLKRRFLK